MCGVAGVLRSSPTNRDDELLGGLSALARAVASHHPELLPALDRLLVEVVDDDHVPHVRAYFQPGYIDPAGRPRFRIVIRPATVAEGAGSTVPTLLHELAHLLSHVRRQKDHEGARHLGAFAVNAEELGLLVKPHPQHGYVTAGLSPIAADRYRHEIAAVDAAIASGTSGSSLARALLAQAPRFAFPLFLNQPIPRS